MIFFIFLFLNIFREIYKRREKDRNVVDKESD